MMSEYGLSDDQCAMRDAAKLFAIKEMMPVAAHYDQTMNYPMPVLEKAYATGLMNLCIPEALGGMGLDITTQCLIVEQLAYGCSGITTAMTANDLALLPVVLVGSREQQEEIVRPMTKGLKLAAYCVTEPNAGSDVAGIRTTAKDEGDHYLLNGEKMWITNASKADWLYVLCTLDPSAGHKAMCAFIIPSTLAGITPGKKEINMGQRCSDTRSLIFSNVKVPKKYRLGQEGEGFKIAMQAFDHSRPSVAALATGVAQCAMDHAVKYAKERTTFGKPIAAHQAIAFMIADMAKDIEASRLLYLKAAGELDAGRPSTKYASMAKCFAGDAAVRITQDAVQIFGGYGFNTEYPVEKLYRDAKIFQIYEGTQQIQRLIISRHVLTEGQ